MKKLLILTAFCISITTFGQTVIIGTSPLPVPQGKKWILPTNKEILIETSDGTLRSGTLCNARILSSPKIVTGILEGEYGHPNEVYSILFNELYSVAYANKYTYSITPISIVNSNFDLSELQHKGLNDIGSKQIVFYPGQKVYVGECLQSIQFIEANLTPQDQLEIKNEKDKQLKETTDKLSNFDIPINPEQYVDPNVKPELHDINLKYIVFSSPSVLWKKPGKNYSLDNVSKWTLSLNETEFDMKSSNFDKKYTVLSISYDGTLRAQLFQLDDGRGANTHSLTVSYSNQTKQYSVILNSIDNSEEYQFQEVQALDKQFQLKDISSSQATFKQNHNNDKNAISSTTSPIETIKVDAMGKPCPGIPKVTDSRDRQIYSTAQIGSQCWLQRNMNYKTGNSWCYDNNTSNCETYGRLYDWETAMKVCPSGWHLPDDEEWTMLVTYLGDERSAGKKMKSISGWKVWRDDVNGDNSSGFTALPGGRRDYYGRYADLTRSSVFWSATQAPTESDAWFRLLYDNYKDVGRFNNGKTDGYSVRCLKD